MHKQRVFAAKLQSNLPDGFQKGQTLNITNSSTDFHYAKVHPFGGQRDPSFNLVCDVRNYLNGSTTVLAATFTLQNIPVNLSRRHAVVFGHDCRGKALVMAEVKVSFGAIISDKHLSMLQRIHQSWIQIQVGVQLHQGHLQAPSLHDSGYGCCADAFSYRGNNSASHKNKLSLPFLSGHTNSVPGN